MTRLLIFAVLLATANTRDNGTITHAAISCDPGNIQIAANDPSGEAYSLLVSNPHGLLEIAFTEFPHHNKLEWHLPFTEPGPYSFGLVRFDRSQPDLTLSCVLP